MQKVGQSYDIAFFIYDFYTLRKNWKDVAWLSQQLMSTWPHVKQPFLGVLTLPLSVTESVCRSLGLA